MSTTLMPTLAPTAAAAGGAEQALLALLALCIAAISVALGCSVTVDDFKKALQMPQAILVGWVSQFLFMPFMGYCLVQIGGLTNKQAIGLIVVCMCPGGTTSNLFTYWCGGNTSLSITMTFASTICAFFMIPVNGYIYIEQTGYAKGLKMDPMRLFASLALLLVCTGIGISIRAYCTDYKFKCRPFCWYCGCPIADTHLWKFIETMGSIIGGLFLLIAVIQGSVANPYIYTHSVKPYFIAGLVEPLGAGFGYGCSWLIGLGPRDSKAVAMETGVQSITVGIAILILTFGNDIEVLLYAYMSGIMYIVNSIWLVWYLSYVRNKPHGWKLNAMRHAGLLPDDGSLNVANVKVVKTEMVKVDVKAEEAKPEVAKQEVEEKAEETLPKTTLETTDHSKEVSMGISKPAEVAET